MKLILEKIKIITKRHKLLVFFFVFFILFSFSVKVFATPPTSPYQASENILDPACAPATTNCYVQIIPDQTGNDGKFLTTSSGVTSWATLSGGGDALVANSLAQFASTTSLQLKTLISDETGSGALVFATSPTLVTPAL